MEIANNIMVAADKIKKGIEEIPALKILGKPYWNISFACKEHDIYQIMDALTSKGWTLNGLHKPSCIHICLTRQHTLEGVAEKFVEDLKEAVAFVKVNPNTEGGMAPVYGLAATLPLRGTISQMLKKYMDTIYKV